MKQHGWDKPKPVQYLYWLRDVAQGDLGTSLYTYQPVTQMIWERLPNTLILMGTVFIVTLAVSIPQAILSALRQYSRLDYLITGASFLAFALPTFWLGLVCIMLFAVKFKEWGLPYLPAGGMYDLVEGPSLGGLLKHLILPAFVLSIVSTASYIRYLRASMLEVLHDDYIRTARAKGLPPATVIFKHALRNAVVPVVALAAVQLGFLLGGSVVIETIFALDGLGYLAYQSITYKDFPVMQNIVLLLSVIYVLLTLASDIANAWLDPRIRIA
jgi:peptide/nickel transport system permease protein